MGAPRAGARRVTRLALALSLLALALLAVSGPATRLGWLHWSAGLGLFRFVAYGGIAGAVLGLLGGIAGGGGRPALGALAAGALALSVPVGMMQRARSVPAIHDVSTDTGDPPRFADPARRAGAANPPEHPGAAVAAEQKRAYPDLAPLVLPIPPRAAFDRALAAVRAQGWEVVLADPQTGAIEAVVTTRWFGFRDDVLIRVRPEAAGSRVDVRSKSRVGRSDLGANAARIRRLLEALRAP
jgi:uncharacterized protein (DUF1499 family)